MENIMLFLPAVTSAALLSIMLGWIGLFMVWRRMVYAGIALCQAASFGALIGHISGIPPFVTGFAAIMGGVGVINIPFKDNVLHKDNITACLYVLAASLTLLALVLFPTVHWGINNLLGGSLLYMKTSGLIAILVIFPVFSGVLSLMKPKWIRLAVHEQEGHKGNLWEEIVFFVLISVIIAVTANWAGVLFTFGGLLFPALCVHLLKAGLKKIFLATAVYSIVMSLTGSACGLIFNLPLGIAIVSAMGLSMALILVIRFVVRNI
ncbi:MAG: metal ABC transporter permease [Candidatus Auribacterota bacterium]